MVQKWTGKSRSNLFFQNIYLFLIRIGGGHIAYFILYFIVAFYTLLPVSRKGISYYLKRRFHKDNALKRFIRTYKINLCFGKILVDRAIFGIKGKIDSVLTKSNRQIYIDLLAKGKGVIIITAHCGCWQSAMSFFEEVEVEKYVIYHRNKEDIDKHAHELSGKKPPINFIDPAGWMGGSFEIMTALAKNGVVAMMGDRTFGSKENAVEVDFLGGKVEVPFSIYRIAGALGVPIVIAFCPYHGSGKIDYYVDQILYVEDKGSKAQSYLKEANEFMKSFEQFTKKYPYQFFNYFNMWK